jgi:hypothetical protein
MKKYFSLALLAVSFAALTSAEAQTGKSELTKKRISVLAIGDPPQPRFVIRDDRRHLLDTAPSDHPPAEILVREKRGGNESFKAVPLGLNSPTGYITYRGEPKLVLLRENGSGERDEFANIALPDLRNDLTIFLLRNRTTKSWASSPSVHYFDNGLEAFPNDSVRLVNLSTVPIRAQINDARVFPLEVGRSTIVRIPRQDQGILSYRIAALVDEKVHPLIDTATTTMPETRFNLIIYNSDGDGAQRPVNIASYFERPLLEAAE